MEYIFDDSPKVESVTEDEVKAEIALLQSGHERLAILMTALEQERNDLIPEDIKMAMKNVEVKYSEAISSMQNEIVISEKMVKLDIERLGKGLRWGKVLCKLMPGRVTWDTAKLEGYSIAHPEILTCRKQGEAFVTISFDKLEKGV